MIPVLAGEPGGQSQVRYLCTPVLVWSESLCRSGVGMGCSEREAQGEPGSHSRGDVRVTRGRQMRPDWICAVKRVAGSENALSPQIYEQ